MSVGGFCSRMFQRVSLETRKIWQEAKQNAESHILTNMPEISANTLIISVKVKVILRHQEVGFLKLHHINIP